MNKEQNNQDNNHLNSIRDIEISERRRKFDNRMNQCEAEGSSYKIKNKKKWPKIVIILVLFIFIFVGISFIFHKAKIEVMPKAEVLIFSNDIYKAAVNDNISLQEKKEEAASGKNSDGKIKIINKTAKTQKLRKETRFQSENGLIYKTYSSVSIPANKTSIVRAYSDGSGEKYNQKRGVELTIPGFKEAKMKEEFTKITGEIAEDFKTIDKDLEKPATENANEKNEIIESEKVQGSVKYKILEIKLNLDEEVESIGVEEVSEKAKGKIKITNNTSKTQKLRKETRFRYDGMIFKTYKSVTIPSKSSIVTQVFADLPGEKFNIKKGVELDIPGFKEAKMDNEFKNIFAVSETDFSGGLEGKLLVPDKEQLKKAKESLEEKVRKSLKLKLSENDNKKDYIFIDKNPVISFNYKTDSIDDKIIVNIEANMKVPIIAKKDFISLILRSEEISEDDIKSLAVDKFYNLDFKILNWESFNIDSGNDFLFSVKGEMKVYWVLDEDLLIKSIKGNSLDELNEKLKNSFKNFEFKISTSPFWRYSIPSDTDDIEIIIKK